MSGRTPLRLLVLPILLSLAACAGGPPARHYAPATAEDAREALEAWTAAQARAASLPPSRLLYGAHMGTSGLPSVPGTLAAAYDGRRIVSASLTGPFGSHVADYREGALTGQDRKAFLVDPDALRSVLAGVWTGVPSAVAGRDGDDVLLTWDGAYRVEAVLDVPERRVRYLSVSGSGGRLEIAYDGRIDPWPERIALKDAQTGRSLTFELLAVEPVEPAADASP